MPYRCRDCRKHSSVKTNSLMHGPNIGYREWAIALYLISTNLKEVSSMKLYRDLGITQKSAWFMLHRICEAWDDAHDPVDGAVAVNENYIGGKRINVRAEKRKQNTGRGTACKAIVVDMKDCESNQIRAQVVESDDAESLKGFVLDNTTENAEVYTDESQAHEGAPRYHEAVGHSVGEYVREQAHTNGLESFWAMMKRGFAGVYHHMSPKHLPRCVDEYEERHNSRPLDTEVQTEKVVRCAAQKSLRYQDFIAGGPAY